MRVPQGERVIENAPREARPAKPRLRGISHLIATFLSGVGGVALVAQAPNARAAWAAGIYGVSLSTLFGVSATYHVPAWPPAPRMWLRRLDHSAIFLLIAGTYTPLCLLGLGTRGITMLQTVWCGAAAGVLQSMLWPNAPKPLRALLSVALGWVVVSEWPAVAALLGPWDEAYLAMGGILYTLGAVVYALRWPDPLPEEFGYHEVFHILVILAASLHFVVVAQLVLGHAATGR